ncbi:hypothetical protein BH11PLA1_BH11PLA1_20260 [soil metagenome]
MSLSSRVAGGRCVVVSGATALLLSAGTCLGVNGVVLTPVAATGTGSLATQLMPQLPGVVGGFSNFANVVMDDHGHVAFMGGLGNSTATNSGVWSTLSGALAPVAASGLAAPGIAGATESLSLRMAFAGNGRIALEQGLVQGTAFTYSVWASGVDGTGPIGLIAREGSQAAGMAGGVSYTSNGPVSVYREGIAGRGLLLSRDGSLLWEGTATGMAIPSSAVWRNDAGGTTLRVTNTQTTPSAGLPWQSFLGDGNLHVDDSGHLTVAASTTVVNVGTTFAYVTDRGGSLTRTYPSFAGVTGTGYSVIGSAGNGDLVVGGFITPSGQAQRFSLIRQDGPTGWHRIVDAGAAAPSGGAGASVQLTAPAGTTINFPQTIAAPSSTGATAFQVGFANTNSDWAASTGLVVASADNVLTLIARTGMTVPGQASNIVLDGMSAPAINNLGMVAFTGTMTASPANLNGRGVFMAQGSDGVLRVIVQAGDVIDIPGLGIRHVAGLTSSQDGNVGGQTWWTDDGHFALIATLIEDPTRRVVITGAIPAPGAAVLLGIGGIMGARRRRGTKASLRQ